MSRRFRILLLALLLLCPGASEAKIDLDWSHTSVPVSPAKRRQIEKLIDESAALFVQESYADLGKLDLRTHERTVLIQIRDFGLNKERGLQLSGAVYLNQARLDDLQDLKLTLVHEFAHLYDFCALSDMTMDYLFSAESGDGRVAEKRADEHMRTTQEIKYQAEKRAHDKMMRYAREHGLKIPGDIE